MNEEAWRLVTRAIGVFTILVGLVMIIGAVSN